MTALPVHCPHRPPCPGCPRFGQPGLSRATHEQLNALANAQGLPTPVVRSGAALGYRHRARLAVRGRAGSPKIGIFQEGTHQVVDIPQCPVHHPQINAVAREIKAELKALVAAPYSDQAHAGLVRYLQLVVERSTQRVQITLVTNSAELDPASAAICEAIERRVRSHLQGLFWNGNPLRNNAILGPHWQHLAGEASIEEVLGHARVFFPPGAFGQSNLPLFEQLLVQVQDWVAGSQRVTELYCGTGALGLGLAQKGYLVNFNEIESASLQGLTQGIAALPAEASSRVRVFPGSADQMALEACQDADCVIADPPRKGLGPAVSTALAQRAPKRFIYVSCGLDSFLRDAETLLQGPYRLQQLEAYALFPFTEHVETLALFQRT
jgi:23S rRNA (uracil-5-)-methyltransferase RumA